METKIITKTVTGILALLSKNILNNSDDEKICAIAQNWINHFNKFEGSTQFTFSKPEDENRLWFILESQKEEIITKLAQLGVTADVSENATLDTDQIDADDFAQSQSENFDEFDNEDNVQGNDAFVADIPPQSDKGALQQVEETIIPVQQPVFASIKSNQEVSSAPAVDKSIQQAAYDPTPAPQPSAPATIPNFFTQSQELAAAAFHDKLCNSLEKAFQATNLL